VSEDGERQSVFDWARAFTGDPDSFEERGQLCLDFLLEEGLQPDDMVLDIGCGALSQGKPLIRHLNEGCYVGVDPAGWLVESALETFGDLEYKRPRFSWRGDFDASAYGPFRFVIAHSVLSHTAQWQLQQAFLNVRKAVGEGAVWLASYRDDQYDAPASTARSWQYPGVAYYRYPTMQVLGFHAGWRVERLPQHRERMEAVAPRDVHDWLRLTAMPSAEEQNRLRLDEEERQRQDEEIIALAQEEWERRRDAELAELTG
jgi:hypothetical protein